MANPFFNRFNGNNQNGVTPFSNINNMLTQFNNFKNSFVGDPRAKVQELLNSGQMTQQQFDQLSTMARQFQNVFKR